MYTIYCTCIPGDHEKYKTIEKDGFPIIIIIYQGLLSWYVYLYMYVYTFFIKFFCKNKQRILHDSLTKLIKKHPVIEEMEIKNNDVTHSINKLRQ